MNTKDTTNTGIQGEIPLGILFCSWNSMVMHSYLLRVLHSSTLIKVYYLPFLFSWNSLLFFLFFSFLFISLFM